MPTITGSNKPGIASETLETVGKDAQRMAPACPTCGARAGACPDAISRLTRRQWVVLRWAASGCSIQETAGRMGIQPQSVALLRSQAYQRLGVRKIGHAIALVSPYLRAARRQDATRGTR